MLAPVLKTCRRCKSEKPLDAFGAGQRWCTQCRNERRDELAMRSEFADISDKICKACRQSKPVSMFHRAKVTRDGFQSRCIECFKSRYGVGTPENNELRRSRYRGWDKWLATVVHAAKQRARAAGVPFSIKPSDIVIPDCCPVLGLAFEIGTNGRLPNSPSLDRLKPELGYVPGNVVVISWAANKVKGTHTDPELFERVAAYIRSRQIK